jgi:muconate cycloisomerase
MRLASLEVIPYALPFRQPYVTARGSLDRREMVLLRLRSDEGLYGLGEAVPLSMRGGATLATVVAELEGLASRDALDEQTLRGEALGLSAPARCAALTALLDLSSQRAGIDSGSDGVAIEPVRCNATLAAAEPSAVAADAEGWAEEGFTAFKLKLGAGDDVDRVRAVRDAVGPDAKIRLDANAAWDVETAVRILSEVEQIGEATSIPVAGDESIESCADAEQAVRMGACDVAATKLAKVGGPEEAIEIAEVMPSYVSSALDGPVGIAAAARVAQTLDAQAADGPQFAHGLATQRLFASTVASAECELRDAMLYLPLGPGLGIEIDEQALLAHRLG